MDFVVICCFLAATSQRNSSKEMYEGFKLTINSQSNTLLWQRVFTMVKRKSVQSALSDLLTTSATHGTFSRPSMKRGLISIIKLMQFTIVRFFQASLGEALFQKACH